ncbi:hypothetical protein [Nonomuraea sp. NPDC050310]|uniref:hypothetical protein n=1 Tax=unclassified Nonomuraea TaxID=2593643 RepID=UPI0033D78530
MAVAPVFCLLVALLLWWGELEKALSTRSGTPPADFGAAKGWAWAALAVLAGEVVLLVATRLRK